MTWNSAVLHIGTVVFAWSAPMWAQPPATVTPEPTVTPAPAPVTQAPAAASPARDGVEGAWQLVQFRHGVNSRRTDISQSTSVREIKLITGGHFIWVVYDLTTKTPKQLGGGTYSQSGNTYTEFLDFGSQATDGMVGKSQKLKLKVEGDRMTESGILSTGAAIEEVWQRLP